MVAQLIRVNTHVELSGYKCFYKSLFMLLNHILTGKIGGLFLHMVDLIRCGSIFIAVILRGWASSRSRPAG